MLPRPSDMVGSLGVVVHVAMNGQQVRVHGHSSSRPAGRLIRNEHLDLASASESGVGTGTATVPGGLEVPQGCYGLPLALSAGISGCLELA